MSKLAIRAEIVKLARLYGVEESALAFLSAVPAHEIRKLREAVQDRLFADDPRLYQRLAASSVLLPLSLVALLARKVFGPVLGARVAGEMNVKRAVELAQKMPVEFLADISIELDPKRAAEIIRSLPPVLVRNVTAELLKRREFITMGRFVDYLPEASIRAAIQAFTDPADMLHVGFFIENKAKLGMLIRMLGDEQLRGTIRAAQDPRRELWAEAVALMAFVDDALKRKLGDLAVEQDEAALAGLLEAAHRQKLWDDVLPVVACMSPASQRKLVRMPQLADPAVLEGILRSADDSALWPAFLPLVDVMEHELLILTAEVAASRLAPGALGNILGAADVARLWPSILRLVEGMNDEQLRLAGAAAARLDKSAIRNAIEVAEAHDLWRTMLPLAARLSEPQKRMIASLHQLMDRAAVERIVAAAHAADQRLWPALLDIVAYVPQAQRAAYAEVVAAYARREPGLVEQLAPAARARGLDDLLEAARKAVAGMAGAG